MSKLLILCSMLLVLLLAGCSAGYTVKVDSLSAMKQTTKKDYVLLPGNKEVSPNDLQYQEFSALVKRALAFREFKEAENPNNASIAIFMEYGIGNPTEHQESYALPIFGQTGVSSSMTTGTVSTYGNTGSFSGMTTYTPTYGVTGFVPANNSYTTYFRFLVLNAYDLELYRASKQEKQLFKLSITSRGKSSDLRKVFPIMLAAGMEYIGAQTEDQQVFHMTDVDENVFLVKGLPVPPKRPITTQY